MSFTRAKEYYGFHAKELLSGNLKICKLLRNKLYGQAEVINWRPSHLLPDRQKNIPWLINTSGSCLENLIIQLNVALNYLWDVTYWLRTKSGAKYKYSLVTFWKERQPRENTIRFIQENWMRVIWSEMWRFRNPKKIKIKKKTYVRYNLIASIPLLFSLLLITDAACSVQYSSIWLNNFITKDFTSYLM